MYNIEKYNGIDIKAVLWINTVWTRSRSGRDGAVLGSKRPRHTTENTLYFLIVLRSAISLRSCTVFYPENCYG